VKTERFDLVRPASSEHDFPVIKTRIIKNGAPVDIEADCVLIAAGRRPNVEGMGLDIAGVSFNETDGVQVDNYLRTSNEDVYAVGDCCSKY